MRRARWIMARWRGNARVRLLGWATCFGLVCGVLGLLEPAEDWLHMVRGQIAPRAASGQIVVVGIDEKSFDKIGRWPWSRTVTARLIDRLNESGVSGIYFDFAFSGLTGAADEKAFKDAMRRSRAPVVLAAMDEVDPRTAKKTGNIVTYKSGYNEVATIRSRINYAGQVRRYPLGVLANGEYYRSMSAHMAGTDLRSQASYPLDTAISPATIPTISASDIILAPGPLSWLKGKKVILGPTAAFLGDIKQYPGLGPLPGVYFHVVGAETLRGGMPIEAGWVPGLLIGLAGAMLALSKRFKRGAIMLAGTLSLLFGLALAVEQFSIFPQVAPGIALIAFVAVRLLFDRAKKSGSLTNSGSGLPNLEALRDRVEAPGDILIALRIHNYADIASSLKVDMQAELVAQIAGRLALGTGGGTLYQGDNGTFAWLKARTAGAVVGDELEGLYAVLRQPVRVGERSIDLLTTFGVERDGSRSFANRIGSAVMAADEARASGEHWRDFDPGSLETADWRLSMLGQIDGAIENGEIWVAFQPQLDLATGRIDGAEALIRWTHPIRGNISPDEFILHAESTGRIDHLTGFVISRAAQAGVAMLEHGIDFRISVNLSAGLLDNPYMVDIITPHVDATNFPRERMTLEITESSEVRKDEKRAELIRKLIAARFRLSIDDYGTGYSTLDYMKRIPAAEIKIDKSFISQIGSSDADREMVASTIDLAHRLKRRVVAEGVEDKSTLEMLRSMECDTIQGYLIGHPMRFSQLEMLVIGEQGRRFAA